MTETIPTNREFTDLAGSDRLNAVAQALRSRGFEVQLVDTVASHGPHDLHDRIGNAAAEWDRR